MTKLQLLLLATSSAFFGLGSGLALAQTPTPASQAAPAAAAAPAVKPASGTVITDMSLSHAVNICELAVVAKVPVQTSLPTAARSMAFVIKSLHGGQVSSTAVLTPKQMFDGSLIEIVTKVNTGCLSKLNAADQKTVGGLIAGIKAAAKLQPGSNQ